MSVALNSNPGTQRTSHPELEGVVQRRSLQRRQAARERGAEQQRLAPLG